MSGEWIQHSKPWITDDDILAAGDVLASGMLAQGAVTRQFEQEMSAWVCGAGGVAVASGAAALVLALRGLEINDSSAEVILPTYLCREVLDAVLTAGARPVLCDVGPDWVITLESAQKRATRHTRAVIVPHLYGIFADVGSFRALGCAVIEDAAQAIGGRRSRQLAGDVTVLSFHPTKCFTTGEGGMLITSDPSIVAQGREIRDRSDRPGSRLTAPLSDIAAAIGLSQLRRYDASLEMRSSLAKRYVDALLPITPSALSWMCRSQSMFYRFPLHVEGGIDRYRPSFDLKRIHVRRGVNDLLHRLLGLSDDDFPMATHHIENTLLLPIHPALLEAEKEACVEAAEQILAG